MQIDYFDKQNLLKIIGRKLKNIATEKDINMTNWASKVKGLGQGDLSLILNGKKGVSSEKLILIAEGIGINKNKLNDIVKEAKKEELKVYYGEDINTIPENIDYEKILENLNLEDLIISLSKEKGTTDEQVLKEIKEYAKFKIQQGDTEFLKKLIKDKRK